MSFFGFFINPDVNHYHILLSVVITADNRDEPETSMDASSTTLGSSKSILFSVGFSWAKQEKFVSKQMQQSVKCRLSSNVDEVVLQGGHNTLQSADTQSLTKWTGSGVKSEHGVQPRPRKNPQQLKYMLNGFPGQHAISHGASSSSAGF